MTDEKPKQPPFTNDIFIADIMLRLTAMEKLLIQKGIFTGEELSAVTEDIAKSVAKTVLEKVKSSKDIESFLALLNEDKKELKN